MTFSLKTIKSRFNPMIVQITHEGWVISHEYTLGKLLKDPCTGKIYFRTNMNASPHNKLKEYRMRFLSKFRYTQQLHWYNRCVNVFGYVVELHGFRKDM